MINLKIELSEEKLWTTIKDVSENGVSTGFTVPTEQFKAELKKYLAELEK